MNIHIDSAHFDDKSIVNKEQCDHCQQKFGTTDELETHMEKCYHKASVTNGSQGNHKWNDKALEKYTGKKSNERQPNSEKAKHQCEICNAIFPRNQILVKHITLDHPEAQLPEQSVIELPPTPNSFMECITGQLSHNPKMIGGSTSVTGEEIRHTVHQFVIKKRSILEVSKQKTKIHMYKILPNQLIERLQI